MGDSETKPLKNMDVTGYSSINSVSTQKSVDSRLPEGQSSILSVLGNLMNVLVGAGILGIPFVFKISGIIGGSLIMIIFGLISIYTLNLLVKSAQESNVFHYEKLCYHCFGDVGYIYVSMCLFILDYGACLSLLIILGDSSFLLLKIFGFESYHDRQIVLLIVSGFLIYPLCLYRDVSYLEILSWIKVTSIVLIIIVVFYEWINMYLKGNIKLIPDISYWISLDNIMISCGIIAFAFICHDTSFLLYNTLYNPTPTRWNSLMFSGVFGALILSISLSIPAYFTFNNNVDSNILNDYSIHSWLIILVRIIYMIAMILTYPLAFFVVRHVFVAFTQKYGILNCFNSLKAKSQYIRQLSTQNDTNEHTMYNIDHASMDENHEYNVHSLPTKPHIIFTTLLFISNLIIALFVDNLGIAMSIVGNISSINLGFVLPCVCYLKINIPYKDLYDSKIPIYTKISIIMNIICCLTIAVVGIFIAIYGTYKSIINNLS